MNTTKYGSALPPLNKIKKKSVTVYLTNLIFSHISDCFPRNCEFTQFCFFPCSSNFFLRLVNLYLAIWTFFLATASFYHNSDFLSQFWPFFSSQLLVYIMQFWLFPSQFYLFLKIANSYRAILIFSSQFILFLHNCEFISCNLCFFPLAVFTFFVSELLIYISQFWLFIP